MTGQRFGGAMRTKLITAALVAGAGLPAQAWAQEARFEFAPFFGSYYAVNNLKDDVEGREKQQAAPALGVSFMTRLSDPVALEASAAYAASGTVPFEGTNNRALGGHIVLGSARFVFRPRRSNLSLLAGVGVINRGGEAWNFPGLDDLTSVAGIVGFKVRAQVTPRFGLNVGVDSHLYRTDPDGDTGQYYTKKLQQDLMVTIGVPIGSRGR